MVEIELQILFQHEYNLLLLILQKGEIALWSEDSQPHKYFLHLFGKQFLDAFIAETNLLEEKILSKGYPTLEVALGWKPISHEGLLVFYG